MTDPYRPSPLGQSAEFGLSPHSRLVRSSFLDFFANKGHKKLASAPLIPPNDPTLMFTAAGMVQFKDVFTGKEKRGFSRATTSQKCIRISGKHNDLENVGVTARHHTFFEMLGNFSFGDYFKEEAICYAWELLTKIWCLPKDKLLITVFGGTASVAEDHEARSIWKKLTGFSDERIVGLGMKDNFWQAGDTGPCGPCTEIHFFHGENPDPKTILEEPTPDGKGWMEIWNLVFMQYERVQVEEGFKLETLPKPCVDTGAGLERISSVLQGKTSNYDSDLLRPFVDKAAEICGKPYFGSQSDEDISMRVIADHARAAAFLIAEGIFPDRAGREYVLRRVMRRAVRHGHKLGIQAPFFHKVAAAVVQNMSDVYPELKQRADLISDVIEQEEIRFRETLERGLTLLEAELQHLGEARQNVLAGDVVFKLYDTYGFPVDLTEVIATERQVKIDLVGYEKALLEQKTRSMGSKIGEGPLSELHREMQNTLETLGKKPEFVGYDLESSKAKILLIAKGGKLVDEASQGDEVAFVTDTTPFYAESGGQIGDSGRAVRKEGNVVLQVKDTQKPTGNFHVHSAYIESGHIRLGEELELCVDHEKRSSTRRNHSATHLLHWALRDIFGETVAQKGSLVGPDRLRFDFSHGRSLTDEELRRIEDMVNQKILLNDGVITEILPIEEAKKKGAVAMFGEKYGSMVRVLTMTSDSVEFCGGTHARALGDIGMFKITNEGSVAAGVRRIEAITGLNALRYTQKIESSLKNAARALKTNTSEFETKLEKWVKTTKELEKQMVDLKRATANVGANVAEMVKTAREGFVTTQKHEVIYLRVALAQIDNLDPEAQRELANKLKNELSKTEGDVSSGPEAAVCITSIREGKVQIACAISAKLSAHIKAGELVKKLANVVGGRGGGRPEFAEGGGPLVGEMKRVEDVFYSLFSTSTN